MNYYPPCCPICGSDATKCEHRPKPDDGPVHDITKTHCWKCKAEYERIAAQCPSCGAVNANVDPDRASAEALHQCSAQQKGAEHGK